MISRVATALAAAALILGVVSADAQSQRKRYQPPPSDQQDQSYLDPGPAPVRTRVPNYVAIGQSDYSQPYYDSMTVPGGTNFEVGPY